MATQHQRSCPVHDDHPRRACAAATDPTASPGTVGDTLQRALAWSTAGLDPATAAQRRAEARRSPAWAARYAYALGYWEGGEAVQAIVADELRDVERQLTDLRAHLARPLWWRLLSRLAWWRQDNRRRWRHDAATPA